MAMRFEQNWGSPECGAMRGTPSFPACLRWLRQLVAAVRAIRTHADLRTAPGRLLGASVVGLCCLTLTACGGGGGGDGVSLAGSQSPDPVTMDFPVFYVKRPVPDAKTPADNLHTLNVFNVGADLYMRARAATSAKETNLTASMLKGLGDVRDVEVSYDAKTVIFSMRGPKLANVTDDKQPKWTLWQYDIAGAALHRVIPSDVLAAAGHDRFPHYLPDGRIVFASTRQPQSRVIQLDEGKPQFAPLDESRRENSFVLHVMNADGSNIHQISFNQSHDRDPSVLTAGYGQQPAGRIVFSRWDHADGQDRINLYSANPDGTDLELLYGANSHLTGADAAGTNNSYIEFVRPQPLPDGRLLTIVRPATGTDEGGDLVAIDTREYVENTQATQPNVGVLSGPAQQRLIVGANVSTVAGPSPGGRYSSAFPLWDGTNRLLVSWTQCRLQQGSQIVPCSSDALAKANPVPAAPLYGLFLYDLSKNTQVPVVAPVEGIEYTDIVAASPRTLPNIILDKVPGVDLDQGLVDKSVGVIDIRSVYDIDGVDRSPAGMTVAQVRDPTQLSLDDPRRARFLRIEKAVGIPDKTVIKDLPGSAFGPNASLGMKEILGYVPIEPDGSVRVRVPANVAFLIDVLDKNGRRTGTLHRNWMQLQPGEVLQCNGCHNPNQNPPVSHGRNGSFQAVNSGASNSQVFPNTNAALVASAGETMAETRGRIVCQGACAPSVDVVFDDMWTAASATKVPAFDYCYTLGAATDVQSDPANLTARHSCTTGLDTPAPINFPQCEQQWSGQCRIVIDYEAHLQPLWQKARPVSDGMGGTVDHACVTCHSGKDAMAQAQVPFGDLDLTNSVSNQCNGQFTSYCQLLFTHNKQALNMGQLEDATVTGTDPTTGLPTAQTIPVTPSMAAGSANASRFLAEFAVGATHAGRLTAAELRLVSEWLDIGAQYYNNPFDAPN